MAKLDFPDASYSPWVAPNNVIYTYIGTSPNGYWEANTANAATNLTAVFVERTGSSMTGDLLIGGTTAATADIALNVNGSATLAGRVDVGGLTVDSNLTPTSGTSVEHFYSSTGGVIQAFDRDNGNLEPLRVRGSTWDLALDGSATFNHFIQSTRFSTRGALGVNVNGTDYAFAAFDASSNLKASVDLNGSASFGSGGFAIDADGEITTNVKSAGHIELDSSGSFSSPKIKLFANTGNATFAGSVETTSFFKATNTGIAYLQPSTVTAFQAYESSGPAKISLNNNGTATFAGKATAEDFDSNHPSDGRFGRFNWAGIRFTDTSGNNLIRLDADGGGSATFADNVKIGDYQSGTAGKNGFELRSFGELVQNRNGGDAYTLYNNSSAKTITFQASGSATFASTVQVGNNPFPGTATGFAAYIDGSIALSSATSSGTIFFGYTTGSSTQTTTIKGNGSATFNARLTAGISTLADRALVANNNTSAGNGGTITAFQYNTGGEVWNGFSSTTQTSTIYANGNATFAGNITAANVSDIRFKENITDANSQLADTVALGSQLKNFDWNDDAPLNDELRAKRFLGLVAQEAEKVCPGLTYTIPRTKQGAELTPEVVVPAVYETRIVPAVLDDEGKVAEAETTEQVLVTEEQVTPATYEELDDSYKAINHDILVMKLLGAVAELSAKVAALEAG